MGVLKKKEQKYTRPADANAIIAFCKGNILTRLSFIICGLGNIVNQQFIRGLIFLALEIGYLPFRILLPWEHWNKDRYIMRRWVFMNIQWETTLCCVFCMVLLHFF